MALTSSIEKTGFWDNLVGRKMNGEIQIAYGHHRIEALRLATGYGYDYEFDLTIREIKDGAMIQIMGLNYFDIYSVQSLFVFFHIIAYFISFGYFIY